ncbi:hypothetical protein SEA_SCHWARTZ33_80 [Gordonia phage Schwartz33]|nr:hypothetical protein SEA_SCHWARTZ33_80 [Gordonia phage Schwartz33]
MKLLEVLKALNSETHIEVVPLDITVARVDFEVSGRPRFIRSHMDKSNPEVMHLIFGLDSDNPNHTGDSPTKYMLAGVGYIPPQNWRRIRKVRNLDGLAWFLYYDRQANLKCQKSHPYFKGEACIRHVGHVGNHQAREAALMRYNDGTDFEDWGHSESLSWTQ